MNIHSLIESQKYYKNFEIQALILKLLISIFNSRKCAILLATIIAV